ncbi:flavin monoamine oxidase family protein [Kribbella speibonae]|uniref:FAD-dependent oxidoreductase n=1 Tax=Kribbella speibonae TaxID=1572660 RepID=A0A4V2M4L3_9ACTN|nr:NAD(P)/FAD-dependent oxidoreductase [Kribbella speibonae]TCC36392.1 FAD-dependent oxidoreductase [Kribbella speibonae]
MNHRSADVVVVGAGVTGLTAATELVARGKEVVVLEARDRVGGRLWTDTIEGIPLELGGQWVSPDQSALLETLETLGLETFARYRAGDSVYIGKDRMRRQFIGAAFPVSARTAAEVDRITAILDDLAGQMDPGKPWLHPRAAELDSISFAQWLSQQTDDEEARDNIALYVGPAMLTKPTHSFSALSCVLMAASAGSFSNLVDADFILDRRVVGGLQQVPLRLAANLGDRVTVGGPVDRIEWTEASAVVHAGSAAWSAARVIVAVPPTLVSRIQFIPNLPPIQMQWRQHQSFGLVIKVHATYDRPFWRADGLSGTAFSPYEVVHELYDNTNFGDERGTLVGFVSDLTADNLLALDPDDRRTQILQSIAHYLGPQAARPISYYESQWMADEWTAGAYATSFDLGGLTRYGEHVRQPVGPLSFGSSDVAGVGFQHVDGAIRVGRELSRGVA